MARPHKGQHKVPRIYLEPFCDDDGQVWVANDQLKLYPDRPHDVLTERDFYTVRFPSGGGSLFIEKEYLGGIEGAYATLYRDTLADRLPLSNTDKAVMAVFLASMIERSPRRRAGIEGIFERVDATLSEFQAAVENMTPEQRKRLSTSPLAVTEEERGRSVPAAEFLELGRDVASLHSSTIPQGVETIAPILYEMTWVFLQRPSGSDPFLTSDTPAVILNPSLPPNSFHGPGLAQDDIEVSLPLSPDLALMARRHLTEDCAYVTCPDDVVLELNHRLMRHSRTLVSNDRSLLEREIEVARKAADQRTPQGA
jgi:Protein of unknown function (DUF4238)